MGLFGARKTWNQLTEPVSDLVRDVPPLEQIFEIFAVQFRGVTVSVPPLFEQL